MSTGQSEQGWLVLESVPGWLVLESTEGQALAQAKLERAALGRRVERQELAPRKWEPRSLLGRLRSLLPLHSLEPPSNQLSLGQLELGYQLRPG